MQTQQDVLATISDICHKYLSYDSTAEVVKRICDIADEEKTKEPKPRCTMYRNSRGTYFKSILNVIIDELSETRDIRFGFQIIPNALVKEDTSSFYPDPKCTPIVVAIGIWGAIGILMSVLYNVKEGMVKPAVDAFRDISYVVAAYPDFKKKDYSPDDIYEKICNDESVLEVYDYINFKEESKVVTSLMFPVPKEGTTSSIPRIFDMCGSYIHHYDGKFTPPANMPRNDTEVSREGFELRDEIDEFSEEIHLAVTNMIKERALA